MNWLVKPLLSDTPHMSISANCETQFCSFDIKWCLIDCGDACWIYAYTPA